MNMNWTPRYQIQFGLTIICLLFPSLLKAQPSIPSGLAAYATGPYSVNVGWNAANNSTIYGLWRSQPGVSDYKQIYCALSPSYNDEPKQGNPPHLSPNTIYSYKVRAGNQTLGADCETPGSPGWSEFSLPISVTTANLGQSFKLEVLDVNPDFLDNNGIVIEDISALSQGGKPVSGFVADGVTQLLLRATTSIPGNIEFCRDGDFDDGALLSLGSNDKHSCLTAFANSSNGVFKAFAILLAPEEFNKPGFEDSKMRGVNITATFIPASGDNTLGSVRPLKILRPPYVFVHGLWSSGETWRLPLATDPRASWIEFADYSATSASSFSTNSSVVLKYIISALRTLRANDIAVTQVDIIAHSMGGLLSRIHASTYAYKYKLNFFAGDIHKLFTLDTPHSGSLMAEALLEARGTFYGGFLEYLARENNTPIDEGAIDDLAISSDAIKGLQPVAVSTHAFFGDSSSLAAEDYPPPLSSLYTTLQKIGISPNDVLTGEHDGIVEAISQRGGLSAAATSRVSGIEAVHTENTRSAQYSSLISDLMAKNASGFDFENLPKPELRDTAFNSMPALLSHPSTSDIYTGLAIISPQSGDEFHAGENIQVTVGSLQGTAITDVSVTGGVYAGGSDFSSPYIVSVKIPDDAFGNIPLIAIGKNLSGDPLLSPTVYIHVNAPSALTKIEARPAAIYFFSPGETKQVYVIGDFEDGIQRPLTFDSATNYSVADTQVAKVTSSGFLTAIKNGSTTLTISHGVISTTIDLKVLGEPDSGSIPHLLEAITAGTPQSNKIWLNDARLPLRDSAQTFDNANSKAVVLGDVDNDGDLDVFMTVKNSRGSEIWLNNAQAKFEFSGSAFGSADNLTPTLGDFDLDGDLDFLLPRQNPKNTRIFLNNGSGKFSESSQIYFPRIISASTGDLDNDNDVDIFYTSRGKNGFGVLLNDGNGTFSDSGQVFGGYQGLTAVLGDIDKDGDLDAVVTSLYRQGANIFLNDGEGIFTDSGRKIGTQRSTALALGDVNGDGSLDVVAANADGPSRVWLNNGGGEFTDSGQELGVANSTAVALGDLDGDADLDAVITARNPHWNKVWLNDGTGHFTDSGQKFGGPNTLAVALGRLR